jgi:DNA-binding NtrC family response regulator
LVARILVEAGYQVTTLADAMTAAETIASHHCDLLITNSVMSGERGARLVAKLRELHPRLPMLHLDDGGSPPPAEFPGDVPTLSKPFSQDILLERVHDLLTCSRD